jgi:hypothetical protein
MNESNDCGVMAVALVTSTPYTDAHYWFWRKGRKAREGVTDRQITCVLAILRHKARLVKTSAKTILGFAREQRDGYYLVLSADHAVAVINGRVCDLPDNSQLLRIVKVYKISKIPTHHL